MALGAPAWYTNLARRLGHRRWFAWAMRNIGWRVDKTLLRMSRGRVDLAGPDIPLMLLTTPGRKSGKQRTVPLAYVRDGDNVAAACENFGLERPAAWPGNALAGSVVVTEIDGIADHRHAREATPAELSRIVPALTRIWPAHDTYMTRTGHRQVIVFEPTDHARWIPERNGTRQARIGVTSPGRAELPPR